MMFSTKAEYGVRVMVELARRAGEDPIPLTEIAEHDGLPLAYLEHLVARLRKAGLVDSRRRAGVGGGPGRPRAPPATSGLGGASRFPARLARRVHARALARRDHDGRGGRGSGGIDRADRVHLAKPR